MASSDIKPTRSGLMTVKRRMALAERVHRLLSMKLDGMMLELIKITDQAASERRILEEKYARAREMAAIATMMEGATGVLLAALSVEAVPTYTTDYKNIFGVRLPELEPLMVKKALIERGYGILATSAAIDDAADAYEDLLSQIIATAERDGMIIRLLDEIEGTRRRVNALEFKVIPELAELRRFIESHREEMERQDIVRLRRIKKIKERRR